MTRLLARILRPTLIYDWDIKIPVILICYEITFALRDVVLETRLGFALVGECLLLPSLHGRCFGMVDVSAWSMFWHVTLYKDL